MGDGFKYVCPKCKKEKILTTGVGMLFSPEMLMDKNNENNILNMIKKEKMINKDEVISCLNDDNTVLVSCEESIYTCTKCTKCTNVVSKLHFEADTNENIRVVPQYICSKCKSKLKLVENVDNLKVMCGNCNTLMKIEDIILWD